LLWGECGRGRSGGGRVVHRLHSVLPACVCVLRIEVGN
jgi:hypothetical protein